MKFTWKEEQLWGDLKNWLLDNVFNQKCAYCERRRYKEATDAEHYRPKGGVKHARFQGDSPVQITGPDGVARPHPGYFWLALDWHNLLPACGGCNSRKGKLNQFPVAKSHSWLPDPLDPAAARQHRSWTRPSSPSSSTPTSTSPRSTCASASSEW